MESKTLKSIRSGKEYDHLIPRAKLQDITVKKGATVSDTVKFVPQVVREYMWQAEAIAKQVVKGETLYDTCSNIWHFLYEHVKYKKDETGKEQVRTFSRLWHDRFKGVDCDCFTTSVLCLLAHHNIKGVMRITKYKENHFQHIYVIVPTGKGDYITIDCVVDKFNYEEPYTEKKDFSMDLQILNGIEDERLSGNVDAQEMLGWGDEMGDFGDLGKLKLKIFKNKASAMPGGNAGGKKKPFQKLKNFAKKALNVVNKLNPATALLRAGILASMKLNIMKVPENLKWAYLTPEQAQAKGADMGKYERLKKILTKMEGIFFTAGGNPENLKKAMLTGRGNRNKEVAGLYGYDSDISGINEYSSLSTLLGTSVYQDEFVNGLDGTDGLGSAVASGAAIASATTVMTAIAALLKSVGSLFGKKKGAEAGAEAGGEGGGDAGDGGVTADSSEGGGGSSEPTVTTSSGDGGGDETSGTTNSPAKTSSSAPATTSSDESESGDSGGSGESGGSASKATGGSGTQSTGGIKDLWEKNKKWMKPLGIGLGAATVIYFGYRAYKSSQSGTGTAKKSTPALNGFGRKKRTKRRKTKGKSTAHHGRKSLVALM